MIGRLVVVLPKAAVDKDPKAVAFANIAYCADATGKVTKAHATIVPKAGYSSYVAPALEQARAWTFKPFTAKTKPVGACSVIDVQYPAGRHVSFEMMQTIDPNDSKAKTPEPPKGGGQPKKDVVKPTKWCAASR